MNMLETYFGVPNSFGVTFAALGGDFTATIGAAPATIKLPRVKWSGDDDHRRADLTSPAWSHIPTDHDWSKALDTHWPWGSPSSYSTKDPSQSTAWVTHFGVTAECADGPEAAQQTATALLDALDDWWRAVCDWIEVLTGQIHGAPSETLYLGDHHPAWTTVGGASQRLYSRSPAVVTVFSETGPGAPIALTPELFQVALDGAPASPPPTEWLLIRDGRLALKVGSTRQAVIDAGTATELAITKLLQDRLTGTPGDIVQALLDGHRMLAKRIALLKRLGGTIPAGCQSGLVDPRNRATHDGTNPPGSDAREALRIANEFVEAAYPLASYR